jgi:hypothetical protein
MTSAGKCFRIPGDDQKGDGFGYGTRIVIRLPHQLYNPGVNQMLNDGIAVKLAERNRGIDHDLTFIPSGQLNFYSSSVVKSQDTHMFFKKRGRLVLILTKLFYSVSNPKICLPVHGEKVLSGFWKKFRPLHSDHGNLCPKRQPCIPMDYIKMFRCTRHHAVISCPLRFLERPTALHMRP